MTWKDIIEKYAIRCAQGNNGGFWDEHYNDAQKEFWRGLVSSIITDLAFEFSVENTADDRIKNKYPSRLDTE